MIRKIAHRVRRMTAFISEYVGDMLLYIRHNGYSPLVDKNRRLFYKLVIEAHAIEKGMAGPSPRPFFGKERIGWILDNIRKYDMSYSPFPVEMAEGALFDYKTSNKEFYQDEQIIDQITSGIGAAETRQPHHKGGIKHIVPPRANPSAISFLQSRSSSRILSPEPLPLELVRKAIAVAQSAPSQCNRQASKAHFYQDRATVAALLELQGGARGFSETIGNLFVISSEISAWGGPQQRNQPYVDGALFSMMVLLSIHAMGLATCPLNLAVDNRAERRIKQAGGIPNNERLIMMIAVGESRASEMRAAMSPRRDTSEILTLH